MRAAARRAAPAAGFSLVEMLISLGLLAGVVLAILVPVNGGLRLARLQPDVADLDQRLRVASAAVRATLERAGAGLPAGEGPGAITLRWPAVFPHRRGAEVTDASTSSFADRFTVISAMPAGVAPRLSMPMTSPGSAIGFDNGPPCSPTDARCGLRPGDLAVIDDGLGRADVFRVSAAEAGAVAHVPEWLSRAYHPADGARVLRLDIGHFRYDAVRRQLRAGNGGTSEAPLLDDVLRVDVRYVGTARPPQAPRPPLGVPTCLFDADGTTLLPVLPGAVGGLVELPLAAFGDGPFCGEGAARYDADLLRIRRVIVSMTVGWPGRWGGGGARSGLEHVAETREVVIDVSPRNLDVSR